MEHKFKACIIDDDKAARQILQKYLEISGKIEVVESLSDTQFALVVIRRQKPDVLFLDINMPNEDGLQFAGRLREVNPSIPIVFTTAYTNYALPAFKIKPIDYLVKPFSFQELEARIKALLRRTGAEPAVPLLSCGDLTLDPSSHRAIRGKVVIDLTVKEYRLLEYLIQNQGTAQSRLTLLKNVWDKNFDTNTNVVDVYVNYLRSKIDKDFDRKLIRTVVGVGYMMEA